MENTEDVKSRYSPPLLWRFAFFVLLCSEASYYLSHLVCHILCFKRYYDQKEEQAHWESSPTSLSFSLLSCSIKTICGNLSHRGAHLHSLPRLVHQSHLCLCKSLWETLCSSRSHLTTSAAIIIFLICWESFSWNLRLLLRFKPSYFLSNLGLINPQWVFFCSRTPGPSRWDSLRKRITAPDDLDWNSS